mgnify:CR=1 FL=1
MDYRLIYLIHMFIVAPIFIYPFIAKQFFDVESFDNYFALLLIVGVVVFFYHGYLLYKVSV